MPEVVLAKDVQVFQPNLVHPDGGTIGDDTKTGAFAHGEPGRPLAKRPRT